MKRLLTMITFLCCFNTALASCVDPALSASDNHSNCLKLAKQGQAEAQYRIAEIYDKGLGVSPNSTVAEAWYLKAAESGLAEAQKLVSLTQ